MILYKFSGFLQYLSFQQDKAANEPYSPLPSQPASRESSHDAETIIIDEDDDYSYEQRKKSILDDIYAKPNEPNKDENELDIYLLLDEEGRDTDPFDWWKQKQSRFPILAILARKYLGICPTSVPSERLFSDVGNNITAKRTSLKPDLVSEMMFLKRNMHLFDTIFPPQ